MRVLVACEFSGVVRDAFRAKGHYAMSCDLLPTDREGLHYQGDIRDIMYSKPWGLMIAHPPCTYLCNGGMNWLNRRPDLNWRGNREQAVELFLLLANANIAMIAIENPIGHMSTRYRKPDQVIRPWMFGEGYRKDICLWLKTLPPLQPTNIVSGRQKLDYWSTERNVDGKSRKSITFQGIADAMAEQWGGLACGRDDR